MRRILCYGDSNTWGYTAGTGERYDTNTRWTAVAQKELGENYTVIEEGLNARTTVYPHPRSIGRNGRDFLVPCLISQKPLDLVVLMLGTNDLQWTNVYGAAAGARVLIQDIKLYSHLPESSWIFAEGEGKANILLIAPPKVDAEGAAQDPMKVRCHYAEEAELFSETYEQVAKETGVYFLDSAKYTQPSPVDGLHLTAESHIALGKAVAEKIKEIFAE